MNKLYILGILPLLFLLHNTLFPILGFQQTPKNAQQASTTPQFFCNMPPNPNTTFDARFLPLPSDPAKTLRLNFVFLHRPANPSKGIAASQEKDPEYQAYINELIRVMEFQIWNLLLEKYDDQCSDIALDPKIRVDVQKVFITNSYYWNNEHDECDTGCPDLSNCPWYLQPLSDSLNQGLKDSQKRINIFFTENQTLYEQVLKQGIDPKITYNGDCSMGYKTDLEIDAKIHMRNEFISYKDRIWHAKDKKIDLEKMLADEHWGKARLILHEIGHTIFGAGHINNNCNLMCGKRAHLQVHLREQQLQEAHRALSTHNMRKYVNEMPELAHSIEITDPEVWNYDIQLWGNLIVKENATLTVSCKLRMPANSQIIIEKGATLIVDGGTILPAFDGKPWWGITKNGGKSLVERIFKRKTDGLYESKLAIINGGKVLLN